jgi:hypothetical protein
MPIPTIYTIISRSDTGEYLSRFEFFSPEMPTWSKDITKRLVSGRTLMQK